MFDLRNKLIKHGISPSIQRIKILEYLLNNRVHPNVDMIYRAIKSDIPTLSRTTVYNTMNIFMEKGLAVQLYTDDNEALYDIAEHAHSHFKCIKCGKLFDIEVEDELRACKALDDYEIRETHIYIKGVCPLCSKDV